MADVSTLSDETRSREQDTVVPDFGALATAAGPVQTPPVIKTTTPDFDAGAELQQTKLNRDAALEASKAAALEEQAVREKAAQSSAQGAQQATGVIQGQQPKIDTALAGVQQAQQAYEGQAQPPSRQLTDFLQPVAGESPENTISKLIHGISLIATGWTGLARGDATAALASLSGALKGWHEGDKVRADRAFADWRAKSDKLLADWEMRHKTTQEIMANSKLTIDNQLKLVELTRTASGDAVGAAVAKTGNAEAVVKHLTEDQKFWGDMKMAADSVAAQKELRELNINIHDAQLQQAAMQFALKFDQTERFHRDEIAQANAKLLDLKPSTDAIMKEAGEIATSRSYIRKMLDLVPRVDLQKISGGTAPWVNKLIQQWGGEQAPPPGTMADKITAPGGGRWELSKDEQQFLALMQDYGSLVLLRRSGATVSPSEMARQLSFVPDQSMNAPTIMARLNLGNDLEIAKDKIAQQKAITGGYRYPVIDVQNIGGGDQGGGAEKKAPKVLTSPNGLKLSF